MNWRGLLHAALVLLAASTASADSDDHTFVFSNKSWFYPPLLEPGPVEIWVIREADEGRTEKRVRLEDLKISPHQIKYPRHAELLYTEYILVLHGLPQGYSADQLVVRVPSYRREPVEVYAIAVKAPPGNRNELYWLWERAITGLSADDLFIYYARARVQAEWAVNRMRATARLTRDQFRACFNFLQAVNAVFEATEMIVGTDLVERCAGFLQNYRDSPLMPHVVRREFAGAVATAEVAEQRLYNGMLEDIIAVQRDPFREEGFHKGCGLLSAFLHDLIAKVDQLRPRINNENIYARAAGDYGPCLADAFKRGRYSLGSRESLLEEAAWHLTLLRNEADSEGLDRQMRDNLRGQIMNLQELIDAAG